MVSGLVTIVVFDGRRDSPTSGRVNEFTLSEKNPGLLIIPPNLYHGWKNIGTSEAIIINMPTRMYNYEAPDALDLPWVRKLPPAQYLIAGKPGSTSARTIRPQVARIIASSGSAEKQSHGLAQAERKASKANRLNTTTRPPPNTV